MEDGGVDDASHDPEDARVLPVTKVPARESIRVAAAKSAVQRVVLRRRGRRRRSGDGGKRGGWWVIGEWERRGRRGRRGRRQTGG